MILVPTGKAKEGVWAVNVARALIFLGSGIGMCGFVWAFMSKGFQGLG
jgi:hypothetical protein